MRSQSPITTDIQTGIAPPESSAQNFFQAAASSLEERQETASHSEIVGCGYGDTAAVARWIEGAQISRFHTLPTTLDLPDLAVEMDKTFQWLCQTEHQEVFRRPSSSRITASTPVDQLSVDSTDSVSLSSSPMWVSDMVPQSIGVGQRGPRFVWSRFSR